MLWETALGLGDPPSSETSKAVERSAGVVSTETGYVVVLSAGGIHVLAADSGAVLAQWWCEPAREPDLAALVGLDVQVCVGCAFARACGACGGACFELVVVGGGGLGACLVFVCRAC